jgi:hypothetical protein
MRKNKPFLMKNTVHLRSTVTKKAVLQMRIRIHVFLGFLHPDPDPLVRGIDPDPSIIKQN